MANIGVVADPAANERRLRHLGRISYSSFKGVTVALFAVACFTVAARIFTRIYSRRRIYLDDYFILFGLACLSGATVLVLQIVRDTFVDNALRNDPTIVVTVQDILGLTHAIPYMEAFVCVAWTAIFSIKFSFLTLFKPLIRRLSRRITIYYWVAVVFTVLTWMFLVSSTFIMCPKFSSCVPAPKASLGLGIITTVCILDIITDIMILSVPILILQKTQMRVTQKLGLAVFLCLSVFMALVAIIRVSGYHRNNSFDVTWAIFWQYLETSIAVIMGSATALRTLFVQGGFKRTPEKQVKVSIYSIPRRLLQKGRFHRYGWEKTTDEEHLPKIPSATLTGLKTFIHHNGHSAGQKTQSGWDDDDPNEMEPKYNLGPRPREREDGEC